MINTAPIFDKKNLPDPKGVPFKGVENAKIPGREDVAGLIDDFIKKTQNNKNIQVCLIKAEWGEGKTDAFDRYISNVLKSDYCYSVSTSTVAKKLRKINTESYQSNTATNFLTALLNAVGDDLYSKSGEKGILYEDSIKDPVNYLDLSLTKLFQNNEKKLYLFLDELEEILYNEDVKVDVISGIKEVINKKFGALCEGGKYEGRLHIFIACTPYAWNTITEDPNFSQVMGSTEQRLSYSLIELPVLTRSDCYNFLYDLTKVTYNGKLTKLPITSGGVFETIINISQRNPRSLIQLFYKLMSNVQQVDNSSISCIDYSHLFRYLDGVTVSVYGSSTPAISNDMLMEFKNSLNNSKNNAEKLVKVFELLTGENKAFSTDEIAERLQIGLKDVPNLINQINEILRNKNNLDSAFETYYKIKEDRNFDHILNNFSKIEKGKDQYITVEEESLFISSLKESLINYVINENSDCIFDEQIIMPNNPHELSQLLGIGIQTAEKFYHSIKNNFDSSKRYFHVSLNLVENIFPSPNLAKFDFIEDRTKRLELRRKVQKELGDVKNREKLHCELTSSIIDAIKLSNIDCVPYENYFLIKFHQQEQYIPILIEGVIENISNSKINELKNLVDTTPAVLTLLFYQSFLDKEIRVALDDIGEIQTIPIEKIAVEQLLCWKKARLDGIKINSISEKSRMSVLINELRLDYFVEDIWIPKAENSGIIIPSLKALGDYGKSDIRPAIASFVSTSDYSLDDQWKFYKRLKSIKLYNSKASFAPTDVETKAEWNAWAHGLADNNFINSPSESIIKSKISPVENRIIQMIKKHRNTQNKLEQEFVNRSNAKNSLQNYYLDTLIQKGKIRRFRDEYLLIHDDDNEFTSKIKMIKDYVNVTYVQNTTFNVFISQTKQRESNVISELDYIHLLQELLQKINLSSGDEKLRLSKLIISIYDYYIENIRPIIVKSKQHHHELFVITKRKFEDFKIQLEKIVTTFNNLAKDSGQKTSSDILLREIQQKFDTTIQRENDKNYDRNEIEDETKNIWKKFCKDDYKKSPFHFEKSLDDAYYFSLPYYNLKIATENFERDLTAFQALTEKANQYAKNIDESFRGIRATTATFIFDSSHVVSNGLLKLAGQIQPPEPPKTTKIIELRQIENYFSNVSETLGSFNQNMTKILNNLKEVDEHEHIFLKLQDDCKRRLENLEDFLIGSQNLENSVISTEYIQDKIHEMKDELSFIQKSFFELSNYISNPVSDITEFVKRVITVNSEMEKFSDNIKRIDKTSQDLIALFVEYIESETKTIINFANICSKPLLQIKQNNLQELRMDFERYSSKLKDRIKRMQ